MKANKYFVNKLPEESKIQDIKRSIQDHDGINAVRVDLVACSVTIDYDEAKYSEGDIKNFVNEAGLQVTSVK